MATDFGYMLLFIQSIYFYRFSQKIDLEITL